MISQVINLSNDKTFRFYKKKYQLNSSYLESTFGIEIRKLPVELIKEQLLNEASNLFISDENLLLTGSFKEILESSSKINIQNEIHHMIKRAIDNYTGTKAQAYKIGKYNFNFQNAYVMGIINVTPDSFSDGGKYFEKENAVKLAISMIEEGVDIIDIGGESTRPGSDSVSEDEELKRVLPVIEKILNQKPDSIISIDTTKSKVAEQALKSGALLVNDISGGTFDEDIFKVVKDYDAVIIIMHIKDKPKMMQESPYYNEVVSEVYDYLTMQTNKAVKAGISKIIIDPGIGFGKRVEDNLDLIERLEDFKSLGFPILIGLSRKSFIGNILNLSIEERDDITNALNSLALSRGARIIRTHNFNMGVQTCKMFNRISGS